jgi:uncharacterized MAPEG superfamily protein
METLTAAATDFAMIAAWSVPLLVVHILTQGFTATRELGAKWNASPRDGGQKPTGVIAGRAERASANFRETYPAFLALCFGLAVTGDPSGWGFTAALVWFAARIVYLPAYLSGVPGLRSTAWGVAFVAMIIMFAVIVF